MDDTTTDAELDPTTEKAPGKDHGQADAPTTKSDTATGDGSSKTPEPHVPESR